MEELLKKRSKLLKLRSAGREGVLLKLKKYFVLKINLILFKRGGWICLIFL